MSNFCGTEGKKMNRCLLTHLFHSYQRPLATSLVWRRLFFAPDLIVRGVSSVFSGAFGLEKNQAEALSGVIIMRLIRARAIKNGLVI
jgi:hypothetical protein